LLETFDAGRLRHVHPGPVPIPCGPSLVTVRAVEIYPSGIIVTWTCSPSDGEVARLAQGTPRVAVTLRDDGDTEYTPLGESLQGGGRTVFGASFFGAAPPAGVTSLEIEAGVTGAAGGGIVMTGRATFALAPTRT
jgi:hypothetical protein